MCLHVRSASSGPRERDSSFTLENSSLRGETEGEDTAQTRAPGRTAAAGALRSPAGLATMASVQMSVRVFP